MDAETFKNTYLPYHQKLYRIVYHMVQDKNDAEDILQETYIKLWHKRNDFESINNTESYAVAVVKNTCLDFLKKAKTRTLQLCDIELPEKSSMSVYIENQDKLNHVQILMERLPVQQQQVMRLKHWENLSDEEIEQVTGLSRGNIKVILSRARKTIRELFLKLEQKK